MKKLMVILLATSLAVGCKGKKGWSQKDKDTFSTNCIKGASGSMEEDKAKSYCNCMMGKLEVKYPIAEDIGKVDVSTMTEMAKDCIK